MVIREDTPINDGSVGQGRSHASLMRTPSLGTVMGGILLALGCTCWWSLPAGPLVPSQVGLLLIGIGLVSQVRGRVRRLTRPAHASRCPRWMSQGS